jgi:hypothetical protein
MFRVMMPNGHNETAPASSQRLLTPPPQLMTPYTTQMTKRVTVCMALAEVTKVLPAEGCSQVVILTCRTWGSINQGSKTAPMVTKIQASTTLYKDNNRSKRPIRAISIFLILLMDSTFHFGSNKISIGTSFKISVKNTDELFYQMRAATARFIP